jgi:hypothetical protein
MGVIFLLLFFTSLIFLVTGLISPSLLNRALRNKFSFSRKSVVTTFSLLALVFLVLIGMTAPEIENDIQIETTEEVLIELDDETSEDSQLVENQEVEIEEAVLPISPLPSSVPTPIPSPSSAPTSTSVPAPKTEPVPSPAATTAPTQSSSCQENQVNINTASREDLKRIIHIDEVRSQEMLQLRPFNSVDSMTRIKGIGSVRLNDIKAQGLACT